MNTPAQNESEIAGLSITSSEELLSLSKELLSYELFW
jgi:hypothetical protein